MKQHVFKTDQLVPNSVCISCLDVVGIFPMDVVDIPHQLRWQGGGRAHQNWGCYTRMDVELRGHRSGKYRLCC
jgi:hypothetical protein